MKTMEAESGQLRPVIAMSWQRAAMSGLNPSASVEDLVSADFDASSRLMQAAGPVLDEMAQALDGIGYCVMLADRNACVVDARWGDDVLRRRFEMLGSVRGALFREDTTGTNSIATTFELRHGVAVRGDEHFVESLKTFSCYGHPVLDPMTKRLEGVLDISCLASEENRLLEPYLKWAAQRIEERLLLGSRITEQHLLAAFHRTTYKNQDRPTIALSEDVFLANRPAVDLLDPADHAALREMVRTASARGPDSRRIRLSGSRTAVAHFHHFVGPGAVLLTLDELATSAPVPSGRAVERGSPPVLVCGEPGSGLTNAVMELAAGRAVSVFDGADLTQEEPRPWLSRLKAELDSDQLVVIESLHLLPRRVARQIAPLLGSARATVVLTTSMFDELSGEQRSLVSQCGERVELTPLRHRTDEIAELVQSMLKRMSAERELRFTPAALEALQAHNWPGNIRELHSVVSRVAAKRIAGDITVRDLPKPYGDPAKSRRLTPIEQAKRAAIVDALRTVGGDKKRAAMQLGISRTTLYTAIRLYGIENDNARFKN
ncbi:hypothetical protein EEB14_08450 [Rhodococcus sp. WS4]|nr:hypothetical protein EEB14_08450 [Rhodococcus sp. WS4]